MLCFIGFSKKDSVMATSLFHLKTTTTNLNSIVTFVKKSLLAAVQCLYTV